MWGASSFANTARRRTESRDTPVVCVPESLQRAAARGYTKFVGRRPAQVVVITNANRQTDGVVSDFKRVYCRRDQRHVASGYNDAREAKG